MNDSGKFRSSRLKNSRGIFFLGVKTKWSPVDNPCLAPTRATACGRVDSTSAG